MKRCQNLKENLWQKLSIYVEPLKFSDILYTNARPEIK